MQEERLDTYLIYKENFLNKYYVYYHIDLLGNIRYIGSGTGQRYYLKQYRSSEHFAFWNNLTKAVVVDNLSKEESMKLEEQLIREHIGTGQLFNKSVKCTYAPVKEIKYSEVSKYLYYDASSPSGLRWKVSIYSGMNYNILERKAGDIAGRINKRGYWATSVNKCRYANHRLVLCLKTMQDIPPDMVVDHVNGNPSDNSFENLRLVTKAQNNRNLKISKLNKTGIRGVRLSKTNTWVVTWRENGLSKNKTFNPRMLFPNEDQTLALNKAKELAIRFRNHIERTLYKLYN